MEFKQRLKRQLLQARQLSEKLLADFKTPAQWVYQVHENCNHALWFVGHMAHADNFFISLVSSRRALGYEPVIKNQRPVISNQFCCAADEYRISSKE